MKVPGYKLRGYDATYEKTTFNAKLHTHDKSCVLEVEDVNSGLTFILDFGDKPQFPQINGIDFLKLGS